MTNSTLQTEILVIGGGASGLAAAVTGARLGAQVLVLEAGSRVGRKLMASGNGRCNLGNRLLSPACYFGDAVFAGQVLEAAPKAEIETFWRSLGLVTVTEESGRIYPFSGQANAVLDALRLGLSQAGVQVRTGARVQRLQKTDHGFAAALEGGEQVLARQVILASGGPAAPKLGGSDSGHRLARSLGHRHTPLRPALVPLTAAHPALPTLKGLRVRAELTLWIEGREQARQQGELLFGEDGLSGVCAMQLARQVEDALSQAQRAEVAVDLLPGLDAKAELAGRLSLRGQLPLSDFFTGLLPRRLGEAVLREAGLQVGRTAASLSSEEQKALGEQACALVFPITGTRGWAHAQVTAGGVDPRQVDPRTLSSRLCPGLYLTGELLDVDGDCGGYNLHFAFATGLLAGRSAGGAPC